MTETWLPVVGYQGLYEVSDLGRVRRVSKPTGGRHAARLAAKERIAAALLENAARADKGLSRQLGYQYNLVAEVRRELEASGRIAPFARKGWRPRTAAAPASQPGPGNVLVPLPSDRGYLFVQLSRGGQVRRRPVHQLVLEAFAGPRPGGMESCHGPGGMQDNHWPGNLRWGTKQDNMADKIRDGTDPAGGRNGNAKLTDDDVMTIRSRAAAGELQQDLAAEFDLASSYLSCIVRGESWAHLPVAGRFKGRPWMKGDGNPALRGELAPTARLNWAAVREARASRAAGVTIRALADRYGVGKSTMQAVLSGRTWREPTTAVGKQLTGAGCVAGHIDTGGALSGPETG